MPKIKDKERILKTVREKQLVTYRGVSIRLSADSPKKLCRLEGISKNYSVMKSRNLQPRLLYPASIHLELKGR